MWSRWCRRQIQYNRRVSRVLVSQDYIIGRYESNERLAVPGQHDALSAEAHAVDQIRELRPGLGHGNLLHDMKRTLVSTYIMYVKYWRG